MKGEKNMSFSFFFAQSDFYRADWHYVNHFVHLLRRFCREGLGLGETPA